MPFQKGQSGNPNGKPPGAKNKKTLIKESVGLESWESLEKYITEIGIAKFLDELKKLKGRAYVVSHLEALEYFKAKLGRTEITLDFDSMTEEQLDWFIKKMVEKNNQNANE